MPHAQEKLKKKNAYTKFWRDNKEYYGIFSILGRADGTADTPFCLKFLLF